MAQEECEVEHQAGEHSLVWDRNLLTTFAARVNLREHQAGGYPPVWDRSLPTTFAAPRNSLLRDVCWLMVLEMGCID